MVIMGSRNISTKTTTERLAKLLNTYYAKKAELPTKVSELTNDSKFQTESQVEAAIKVAVAGALQPAGSVAFADLPALAAENVNKIVNVTDTFTTTADFVEGAGVKYPAGTNIAIIKVGEDIKYDTYTGVIDISGFAEKVSGATAGNFAGLDANGNLTDSGKKPADFAKVEASEVNGNVKINGVETAVYTLPATVLQESDVSDYTEAELRTLLGLSAVE